MTVLPQKQSFGTPLAGVVPFVATQNSMCVHYPDRWIPGHVQILMAWWDTDLVPFYAFLKWASPSRALLRCPQLVPAQATLPTSWFCSGKTLSMSSTRMMWLDIASNSSPVMSCSGVCGFEHLMRAGICTLGISYTWCLIQTLLTSKRLIRPLDLRKDVCTSPKRSACANITEDRASWGTADGYRGNLSKTLSFFLCRPG